MQDEDLIEKDSREPFVDAWSPEDEADRKMDQEREESNEGS